MIAAIWPRATPSVTPPTAWKPSNALLTSRTSSMTHPEPRHAGGQRPNDAAAKGEQDHDEHGAEQERTVLRVRRYLQFTHEKHERTHREATDNPNSSTHLHNT